MDHVSNLKPLEVGMMFWADRDNVDEIASMGVHTGQLCLGGDTKLTDEFIHRMKQDLARRDIKLVTVFVAYDGEDYADLPTVQQTVGFIPRSTRAARRARTLEVINVASRLGAPSVGCHIGCVPHDKLDPDYIDVRDLMRELCDVTAKHGQTFSLETGQESAQALLEFLHDVGRPNLKVNFDPANMILYGSGDPHEAVRTLGAHIVSVHAKDGDWPPPRDKNALGKERPLGQGSVNFPKFIETLRSVGYTGPLCIEREAHDPTERIADMRSAVPFLRSLL